MAVKHAFRTFRDISRPCLKMNNDLLCPGDVKQLSDLVQDSLASKSSLLVKGTGSKDGWGHPDGNGQKVQISGISGITLYEPEELVMTAAAGTTIGHIKNLPRRMLRNRIGYTNITSSPNFFI